MIQAIPFRSLVRAGLAMTVLGAAATALADDSNFVRFGGEHVVFHDSNAGFSGPGIPPGADLQTQTQDLNAIFFSVAHAFTPHLELEAILGVPPSFEVHMRGAENVGTVAYRNRVAVTGKQMSPGVVLNYTFNEPGSFYRPYFGVGLVYSHFYDIQPGEATSQVNGGPTSLSFTDTLGALMVAGVTFRLEDHWRASLSISKADVRPDVTSHTLGVDRINHYDLSPIVFTGALSYGF